MNKNMHEFMQNVHIQYGWKLNEISYKFILDINRISFRRSTKINMIHGGERKNKMNMYFKGRRQMASKVI